MKRILFILALIPWYLGADDFSYKGMLRQLRNAIQETDVKTADAIIFETKLLREDKESLLRYSQEVINLRKMDIENMGIIFGDPADMPPGTRLWIDYSLYAGSVVGMVGFPIAGLVVLFEHGRSGRDIFKLSLLAGTILLCYSIYKPFAIRSKKKEIVGKRYKAALALHAILDQAQITQMQDSLNPIY